ncbi:hypothetical protein ACPCKL_33040 [Streptomyces cellulosae]
MRRLLRLCASETDPERRAFLARSAYTVGALAVPGAFADAVTAVSSSAQAEARPDVVQVGAGDAAALQDMAQTFAALSERYGGAYVRSMLAAYLNDQVNGLLYAPASSRLRSQLLTGAAQLTHLLAASNDDCGHPGLAQHYFHASLDLSRQAEDRRLHAITLRAMSVQALRLGHPGYAHRLVVAAVEALRGHEDPATVSFLLVQSAHTHAVNGERRQAVADLVRAERSHERTEQGEDPFSHYPRAALDYQRSLTLGALGDVAQAFAALESSAGRRSLSQRKSLALTESRLAQLCLEQGHVEAAVPHAERFIGHYGHLRSAQADTALERLTGELSRYPRLPQAVVLRRRLRTLRDRTPQVPT